jgi:RNA polymerase sigma-70 factor (ECF subfamily)
MLKRFRSAQADMSLTSPELSELMLRVAGGDRVAFAAVYRATSAKLYGIVLRILRTPSLADEMLQETYVRIWNNAATFDPSRASPITWMAAIARNRALDELRRAAPLPLAALPDGFEVRDPQPLVSERMEQDAEYARLRTCLDGLEPERRQIVQLAYLEGRSREELGQMFGHPAATIKTWLHRSLKQLRACLST